MQFTILRRVGATPLIACEPGLLIWPFRPLWPLLQSAMREGSPTRTLFAQFPLSPRARDSIHIAIKGDEWLVPAPGLGQKENTT